MKISPSPAQPNEDSLYIHIYSVPPRAFYETLHIYLRKPSVCVCMRRPTHTPLPRAFIKRNSSAVVLSCYLTLKGTVGRTVYMLKASERPRKAERLKGRRGEEQAKGGRGREGG